MNLDIFQKLIKIVLIHFIEYARLFNFKSVITEFPILLEKATKKFPNNRIIIKVIDKSY